MFTCIARLSTLKVCSQFTVVGIIVLFLMYSLQSNGYFSLSKTLKTSSRLVRVMTSIPIVSERILCLSFFAWSIRCILMATSSIIFPTSVLNSSWQTGGGKLLRKLFCGNAMNSRRGKTEQWGPWNSEEFCSDSMWESEKRRPRISKDWDGHGKRISKACNKIRRRLWNSNISSLLIPFKQSMPVEPSPFVWKRRDRILFFNDRTTSHNCAIVRNSSRKRMLTFPRIWRMWEQNQTTIWCVRLERKLPVYTSPILLFVSSYALPKRSKISFNRNKRRNTFFLWHDCPQDVLEIEPPCIRWLLDGFPLSTCITRR